MARVLSARLWYFSKISLTLLKIPTVLINDMHDATLCVCEPIYVTAFTDVGK